MKPAQPGRRLQRGVTLIELMVAITLGMVLVATFGYTYLASRKAFQSLDISSRLQENARFAFDTLTYDVRMAGFTGCSSTSRANVLNNPGAWDLFDQPLIGYEAGVSTFPAISNPAVLRGDALTILRADNSREYRVDSHNPTSAQFQLKDDHDLKQGEILVVTDCSHAAVFQMTRSNNNDTNRTVNHNTGNTTSPGNCTKGFGSPVECTTLGNPYPFSPGSQILRLSGITYYVGTSDTGEPALFRRRLTHSNGNATTVAEELAEGVENMQIRYGVDTSATPDGVVDSYVTADQVTATAPGANTSDDWQRVLSVRIQLLMVSRQDESVTSTPQRYTFNGTATTPGDRRLRRVFTTTIAIRNRL
ncbi:PilW family protein [Crenobacter cavernae]|uniref:Prepilin-type N-terminal cleavage/methylation domain-containing protein n=1 Tax=Crenobacter cavernae TaxID=2290923 RepID=A0A345YAH0_9NEIS|nr:PilW family protein [Crenobacter cavernae]AXK40922.1 prepilin-type N-terminal cleavage/methylation domain-containing protein [Crenobacter cavernae]